MPTKKASRKTASKRKLSKGRFSKFIVGLATDPEKMERLKADPEGVMTKARLTPKEKTIIRSGDAEAMLANINPKYFEGEKIFSVVIIRVIITVKPVMAAVKRPKK